MEAGEDLRELARQRAQEIAPRPTVYERAMVYFMLVVPGLFGGMYLADAQFYIRAFASLIWFAGFIYTFYWVQVRQRAHERAVEEELKKLSG